MAEIRHHLTEPLIAAYAAGRLPEAYSLVVATHVSLCDDCRAALAAHEAMGGVVLGEVGTAELAPGSLEATLARIDGRPAEAPSRPASGILPGPLQGYVGGDLEAVRWRAVGGGVRQAVLPTAKGATARLLRIAGGSALPEHGHRGLEMTLVLRGAFSDADGTYRRGDVEVASTTDQHTPVAEPGEECICLAATDAPLRFVSLLPRLVQPFIGI